MAQRSPGSLLVPQSDQSDVGTAKFHDVIVPTLWEFEAMEATTRRRLVRYLAFRTLREGR